MTSLVRRGRRWTLPLALGFSDGILNALILASTALLKGHDITVSLAMKVGCVAFVTAIVTMFVADYAERRVNLSRSSQQLNLTAKGHLAATQLGRRVRREAAQSGLVASVSSFVGASVPLVVAGAMPSASWIGLVVAVILLGVLGAVLAVTMDGRWQWWTIGLVLAGAVVAAIGAQLDIA